MTLSEDLIISIKEHEGFVAKPYKDHLGFLTIGFGTLIENGITREEAHALLVIRLKRFAKELMDEKSIIIDLSQERQDVLIEMAYQLGVRGVLKFKKMWLAIEKFDFDTASREMIDSKWAKQTPNRAFQASKRMSVG